MGFRFRKSVNFGPFRVNLSKSGVGYSFGGKGFRFTKKAGGGTRTTASIPGTGISYVKDHGSSKKKTAGSRPAESGESSPKRPIYQRPWFVALVILFLLGALASACSGDDSTPSDDPVDQQEETIPAEDQATETEDAADPEALPGETSESQDEPESAQETQETVQEPVSDPDPDTPSTPESAPAGQESQESTGSTPVVTPPVSEPDPEPTPAPQPQPEPAPQENTQKTGYVGSIDSDKYHSPGCRWVKKILPENEIWFATKEEAAAAGYSPCGTCQ